MKRDVISGLLILLVGGFVGWGIMAFKDDAVHETIQDNDIRTINKTVLQKDSLQADKNKGLNIRFDNFIDDNKYDHQEITEEVVAIKKDMITVKIGVARIEGMLKVVLTNLADRNKITSMDSTNICLINEKL